MSTTKKRSLVLLVETSFMGIEDIIPIAAILGIGLLGISALGFTVGYFDFLPIKRSDQIELHTESAFSNTTQLDDVPANVYRLNCRVQMKGYHYGLLGVKIRL